jgi:protein transport protein SEC61 subunit gamma-like protein
MSLFTLLKDFIQQCGRVWTVTKKPSGVEFKTIAKASAIGLLAIGFVGFVVSMAIRMI